MAKDLSRSCPICEGLQEYKDFAETRNVRELLVGLTHEIGNNLQAIRSELDLLTLSGALPEQSSKTVIRGVQQIRKLTVAIDVRRSGSRASGSYPGERARVG